ncbi:diguanylate cyclase domain-containing protein [Massilia sp. CF038]|uniref:diguanylate cyclase domain-containing protein n=1 Tax=Massilia sp. CF038 TaxID=1881045 RepID=UPI00091ADDB4|nr:diguanylate cyclase [Massilia sp. CF038]SHG98291.1 response regulator receiver modulated diguanylate cyclase [Massilia sp. CF038]
MTWGSIVKKGRILIVDDAMENIQILHQALQDEHDVLFAMNGTKALHMAQHQLPDLILLDAMMPDMDGYAVCAALRASELTRDIPIIFVTALKTPEDETRALSSGAADFISKPVNAAVVRARVRTQLTVKFQSDALRELTLTDSLTGVANRRAFDERLDAEWRRCARSQMPIALILVDIDHFKNFNDAYGHQAGDACLKKASEAMGRAAMRPQDLLARYGGEEFAILLPYEDLGGAEVVAGKVIDEVARLAIPHERSSVGPILTVSMGVVSVMPSDRFESAMMIRSADALLYEAKAEGRNRFKSKGQ